MPIEFRCTQCAKLLRTGDDTAGKQAKCPACQTIVTVPSVGQTPPPSQPAPPQPGAGLPDAHQPPASSFGQNQNAPNENPFGGGYAGQGYAGQTPQPDSGNPYQAPSEYSTPSGYGAVGATGDIRPSEIDFGETFNRTWAAFTDQLGMCILVAFLCIIMNIVIGQVAKFGANAVGIAAGDEILAIVASIILWIPTQMFGMWIGIGQAMFFLKVARGQEAPISDIFAGGPYFLRILGATVMITAVFLAFLLPGGVIALLGWLTNAEELLAIGVIVTGIGVLVGFVVYVIVILILFQFYYLIIDRNMGIMEAFSTSRVVMAGNKATVFGLMLVTIILAILFVICTCLLGMFAAAPYMGILYAIIYLAVTGQPTMSDYREMQYNQQAQPYTAQ